MSALSDPDNGMYVVVDDGDSPPVAQTFEGTSPLTDDEVYKILTQQPITAAGYDDGDEPDGDDDSDEDNAPEEQHTGSMIALIPSDADLDRLALPGGEDRSQLHLTLWFMGDNAQYDDITRAQIVDVVQTVVLEQSPIVVTGFGVAVWNPLGENPAVVMNVGGEGLEEARECVGEALEELWAARIPAQHEPWVPHICLAYTSTPEKFVASGLGNVGPLTLDRVRVAFGDTVTDIPLGYNGTVTMSLESGADVTDTIELATDSPSATGDSVGGIGNTNLPATVPMPPGMFDVQLATLEDGSVATWEGILVQEGVETGDGRMFAPGSLTWPPPWLPLRWAPEDFGAHDGAVDVGRIDWIQRDPNDPTIIRGGGVFNVSSPVGLQAFTNTEGQFQRGLSIDVDSVKDADVEYVYPQSPGESDGESEDVPDDIMMLFGPEPELTVFHAGRIRGATLVSLPAYVEAQISASRQPLETGGAAVTGTGRSPSVTPPAMTAAVDTHWDDAAVRLRLKKTAFKQMIHAYTPDGSILHHDAHGDGRVGAANITACLEGMRRVFTDKKMPLAQRRLVYDHLAEHLRLAGLTPQPFSIGALSDDVALTAAGLIVDDGYEAPPAEWFADPGFDWYHPLTVTDEGRIYGHLAEFGSRHRSFSQQAVYPPRGDDFSQFHLGEVVTRDGQRVAVGGITLGTGHAPTDGSITARQAAAHYDNTGTRIADVICGNDDYGIWVAGAVRQGTPASRVAELRAATLSGDWRWIGGQLRLVAALAVNVPGFAVERPRARVADGRPVALVAAGIPQRRREVDPAIARLKARLATRVGLDPASKRAALRRRIHGAE